MNNPASNHDRYDAIAAKLSDAVIHIQATHPDWIQARFRERSLADKRPQLVQKFAALLHANHDFNTVIEHVIHLLEQLLEPVVSETEFYQKARHLVATELSTSVVPLREQAPLWQSELNQDSHQTDSHAQAIAILLLDAENIDLNSEAEDWIETHCQYPLTLKFAFGNWKRLGKRDAELHQRGYQLLHVPKGKNHADDTMTMIGSSMPFYLPNIKEAIVCSNDKDLENLQTTMRFQGRNVSLLQRHQQTLKLTNCKSKTFTTFNLPTPATMPSVERGIQYCQDYLSNSETTPISLSELSSAFSKALGFPISAFVKHHTLAKTPKAFFQQSNQFKVTVPQDKSQCYVSNFAQPDSTSAKKKSTDNSQQQEFTVSTLRRVCVGIAKTFIQQQAGDEVPLVALASVFRQQHGQPIKTVLKQLELGQSLPKFLQTCNGLKLRQEKNAWLITLAE